MNVLKRLLNLSRLIYIGWIGAWVLRLIQAKLRTRRCQKRWNGSERIPVAFVQNTPAVWKFSSVIAALKASPRYAPKVLIWVSSKNDMSTTRECVEFCLERGYDFEVLNDLNEESIAKVYFSYACVFFSLPYGWARPSIWNGASEITRPLHGYVPYAFNVSPIRPEQYGWEFMKRLDLYFHPTEFHKRVDSEWRALWTKHVVSGYPALSSYTDLSGRTEKRETIIYAPHHTLSTDNSWGLGYSTFKLFGEGILDFAEGSTEDVKWVFKPHPLLREKLAVHDDWGPRRVEEYYARWERLGGVHTGNYDEIFRKASALIHDSGSFLAEWHSTGRPSMYLRRSKDIQANLNAFGEKCLEVSYHGYGIQDIVDFVKNVVRGGVDRKQIQREAFVNSSDYNRDMRCDEIIVERLNSSLGVKSDGPWQD